MNALGKQEASLDVIVGLGARSTWADAREAILH